MASSVIKNRIPQINGVQLYGDLVSADVNIGTETVSPSAQTLSNVASGTTRSFSSNKSLTAGTWFVTTRVRFTQSGTGTRHAAICDSSGTAFNYAEEQCGAAASGMTNLTVSTFLVLSSATTVKVGVWQTSGSAMDISIWFYARKV